MDGASSLARHAPRAPSTRAPRQRRGLLRSGDIRTRGPAAPTARPARSRSGPRPGARARRRRSRPRRRRRRGTTRRQRRSTTRRQRRGTTRPTCLLPSRAGPSRTSRACASASATTLAAGAGAAAAADMLPAFASRSFAAASISVRPMVSSGLYCLPGPVDGAAPAGRQWSCLPVLPSRVPRRGCLGRAVASVSRAERSYRGLASVAPL